MKSAETQRRKKKVRKFIVSELVELPLHQGVGRERWLNKKEAKRLFKKHPKYTDAHGCYVFGIRTKGFKPVYVGKATEQSLGTEALSDHKVLKINSALRKNRWGRLVVAFVIPEKKSGRPPKNLIEEIEHVLIQYAYAKNPQIENVHGISLCGWFIEGVMNRIKGRPSAEAEEFRQLVGITHHTGQKASVAIKKKRKKACPKGKKGK